MKEFSRRTVRFDAERDRKLKMMHEEENRQRAEKGMEKVSENSVLMDCIDYRFDEVYDKSRLKKEAEQEKVFYAQMNDKIISKYFNVLMDCLEGIATQLQDQELYIRLLSVKNDVAYLLESKGEDKLLKQIKTDEKKIAVLKSRHRKDKEAEGVFKDYENKDEDEEDNRKFL